MTKLLFCGACLDVRSLDPDGAETTCRCGNMTARWIDPVRGTVEVSRADRSDLVRIIGMHNEFIRAAFGAGVGSDAGWRNVHDHITTARGFLFDKSRRACWACIVRVGETNDITWAPEAAAPTRPSGDREHPLDPEIYGHRRPDGQYERHPTDETGEFVAPIRNAYRHLACGGVTTCGDAIAITYAKHPHKYGGTFCASCGDYFDLRRPMTVEEKTAGGHPIEQDWLTPAFEWEVDGRTVGTHDPDEIKADRAEAGVDKRKGRPKSPDYVR